jgi:hypothetical protein
MTVDASYRWWAAAGVGALVLLPGLPGAAAGVTAAVWLGACAGVVLLARPWPGWRAAAGVLAGHLGLIAVGFVVVIGGLQMARPFTALAGNEPVDSADSDVSLVLFGVVIALMWTGVLQVVRAAVRSAERDTSSGGRGSAGPASASAGHGWAGPGSAGSGPAASGPASAL